MSETKTATYYKNRFESEVGVQAMMFEDVRTCYQELIQAASCDDGREYIPSQFMTTTLCFIAGFYFHPEEIMNSVIECPKCGDYVNPKLMTNHGICMDCLEEKSKAFTASIQAIIGPKEIELYHASTIHSYAVNN